ncbi:hypothetical protein GGS23DRAFT_131356 [Durotheca rogersii]|uniref:uncharacterized protein n=1 Tax=Durotheca rogersii TaxID=419775 RepID=UPI0022205A2D|nr:uncharacterized protein GGS23DRAFT_131356 [Durotheca rogersii]KAI5861788.1 hypothetical protein GGS23DRAFT_131356 [Durotheca rogersii]
MRPAFPESRGNILGNCVVFCFASLALAPSPPAGATRHPRMEGSRSGFHRALRTWALAWVAFLGREGAWIRRRDTAERYHFYMLARAGLRHA